MYDLCIVNKQIRNQHVSNDSESLSYWEKKITCRKECSNHKHEQETLQIIELRFATIRFSGHVISLYIIKLFVICLRSY